MTGKIQIVRVVEQCNPFDSFIRNGPGIVHPPGPFPEDLLFVHGPFGVANGPAAIVNADSLGHPNADHPERRLAERNAPFDGLELHIDNHKPFELVQQQHRYLTSFFKEDFRVIGYPVILCNHGRTLPAVLEFYYASMPDLTLAPIAPEAHPIDIVVSDPDRIMMTMRFRIVRMPHTSKRPPRRPVHRKKKRPIKPAPEVIPR